MSVVSQSKLSVSRILYFEILDVNSEFGITWNWNGRGLIYNTPEF
jgi:hypothetical protein